MATDIIARGMAAGSVKLGEDGKIPAEYLPSYVDDIIDLIAISDTAPVTCAKDDKYYNSTDKLIYTATATDTWGTTGEAPVSGVIYINTGENPSGSYRWDGNDLVLIGASGGGGKAYYLDTQASGWGTITSGALFDTCKEVLSDIFNNKAFDARCKTTIYTSSGISEAYDLGLLFYSYAYPYKQVLWFYRIDSFSGSGESSNNRHYYPGYALYQITLNYDSATNELTSVNVPYRPIDAARFLPIGNNTEYNPWNNYNPATVKFVKDTATDIANKKTAMLNYEGGEHNKIYLSSDNTLTPNLPETAVESGYHGANYTMEYTYTTAQSITPATRFSAHIVKILKTTYISAQTLTITASVVRDGTALVTKTITGPSIAQTSGTADVDTVDFDIPFDLELLEPLEIQVGDIFRVVVKCSNTGNYNSNGAIYSSSTNATYIEQYANGISAEDVYDTINGTTYSQHEINAMGSGGGVEGTHPVYTWDGNAISSSDTDKLAYIQKFFDDVVADKQPILLTNKSITIGNMNWKREVIINYKRYYNGQMSMEYAFLHSLNGGNSPAQMCNDTFTLYYDTNTMKVTSMGGIPDVSGSYHMLPASWCDNSSSGNNYNSASNYYLAPYNFRQYDVNTDWQPAHKKYVDDKIIWNVGGLLNYDGGEHSKIYFNAANVLGISAPENPVESPLNGPAYTMEYTYTSAQSITPSTKYTLHIVKILKTTYLSNQNLTATISIIRNGTTLASKVSSSVNIPYTTGTQDLTTVSAEIVTNLGIEETLEIQSGDIFRVVISSSQSGNYQSNGAIYSSSTEPTYIEQYSGGMDANNVYDTINGTTYTQHEINQMGGGGDAPIYLITGTTQADVDKINECCNLFTQNKPFTAYYKSTAQYGPKYVPIIFFTMGTNDIFMNFIGWAGYSGNGQTLIWGQIQGTGTPGQYSAIQITDSASNYKEVLYEGYLQNFSNYSQYKMQTFKNDNGTFIWEDDADVIAPKYSSSSTYAVGDYVMYQGKLYVCSTAISQAEDWTAAHWTQTTVAAIIGNLNTVLASLTTSNNGGN